MDDKAIALLEAIERQLRELVGKVAASGEYEAVLRLTAIAQSVTAVVVDARADGPPPDVAPAEPPEPAATLPRGRSKGISYPRFVARNGELLKIGWSKKAKREYTHRVPRTVVDALTQKVKKVSPSKRQFATEDLLPLVESGTGNEVPEYQAYVALAFLREMGIVEKHGRQGYTVKAKRDLDALLESAWASVSAV